MGEPSEHPRDDLAAADEPTPVDEAGLEPGGPASTAAVGGGVPLDPSDGDDEDPTAPATP